MAPQSGKYWLILFVVLFPFYLTFTFDHSLWNPDETRDAGIARAMFVDRNFVSPKLNGEAFLEKPPLYYWTCSVVYFISGKITAGTTRLPAALYGFLGILFTFLIGRRFFSPRAGLMAALILGTSIQYFRMSHFALMDSALAALLAGAFYFYLIGVDLGFILFVILAFYTKGFLAVVLAGLVIGMDLIWNKESKRLLRLTLLGVPLFVLAVGPWIFGLWKEGGFPFLKVFFIENHFRRFTSQGVDHANNPFFMYFLSFPGDFLPWTFLFVGALIGFFREKWTAIWRCVPLKFFFIWFSAIFLILTISSSKRSMYLLPAFPAAALIAAVWLERVFSQGAGSKSEKVLIWASLILLSILSAGVPLAWIYLEKEIIFGIGALLLAGGGIIFIFNNVKRPLLERVAYGAFFFAVFSITAADFLFVRRLDEDKSFLPFIEAVKEKRDRSPVVGFQMSEMERGVFPFYFEENIPNLKTGGDLENFLEGKRESRVLVMSNRNNLRNIPPETASRLNELYSFRPHKKSRSYLLWETKP